MFINANRAMMTKMLSLIMTALRSRLCLSGVHMIIQGFGMQNLPKLRTLKRLGQTAVAEAFIPVPLKSHVPHPHLAMALSLRCSVEDRFAINQTSIA